MHYLSSYLMFVVIFNTTVVYIFGRQLRKFRDQRIKLIEQYEDLFEFVDENCVMRDDRGMSQNPDYDPDQILAKWDKFHQMKTKFDKTVKEVK